MKSPQKRAVFKKHFGEILLPLGFHLCGERFIRLHGDAFFLQVEMELDVRGNARIRFGAMPLCVPDFDPRIPFGEYVSDFAPVYPYPEGKNPEAVCFEDGQFELQLDLFRAHLLEPFAKVQDMASLMEYQENCLEKPLGLLAADLACYACLYMRDYVRARKYAEIWKEMKEKSLNEARRREEAAIMACDCTMRDRKFKLKDLNWLYRYLRHDVYAIERLINMIDLQLDYLIQNNIRKQISAAETAFYNTYPKYPAKE